MKYQVIAIKWDIDLQKQVEYVAGEFPDVANANVFVTAYKEHYCTSNVRIVKKGGEK